MQYTLDPKHRKLKNSMRQSSHDEFVKLKFIFFLIQLTGLWKDCDKIWIDPRYSTQVKNPLNLTLTPVILYICVIQFLKIFLVMSNSFDSISTAMLPLVNNPLLHFRDQFCCFVTNQPFFILSSIMNIYPSTTGRCGL